MFKLVNRSLFPSHGYSIHFHPLSASHFHYLKCIVCLHFICFCFLFCMSVKYLHWNPFCFCFYPLIAPPPPPPHAPPLSPTHRQAASQSKAQKKLQPLTQVPVLQEQGEYCAGVGGVRTWVPAVWSRGVVFFFPSFPLHASVLSLNFHLSAHLQGWFECWHHSHPLSHCPREMPHMQSQHQAGDVGFSLVCLCICPWAPEECPAVSVCVCVCSWLH